MKIYLGLMMIGALSFSCKKKVIVENKTPDYHSGNGVPAVPNGEWRGEKDDVDSKLGTLKNLD